MIDRGRSAFGNRSSSRDEDDDYTAKEEEYEEQQVAGLSNWNTISMIAGGVSLVLALFTYHEMYSGTSRVRTGVVRLSPPSMNDVPPTSKFTFPPRDQMPLVVPATQAKLPRLLGGGQLVDPDIQFITFDLQTSRGNPFATPLTGDDGRNELINELNSRIYPSDTEGKDVQSIFTDSMYQDLKETLAKSGSLVGNLDSHWKTVKRMTFEEFLISPQILSNIQRLDHQTSPFVGKFGPHMRPSATTCSEQLEMENVTKWFQEQWMTYIFQVEASSPLSGQQGTIYGLTRGSRPCTGEALVALAVYDTIMLSILSEGGRGAHFREVRERQCSLLADGAQKAFLGLLEEGKQQFRDVDAIILRNINADLAEKIRDSEFGSTQFELKVPRSFNKLTRDNPAILLRIARFFGPQEVIVDAFEDQPEEFGRSFVLSATRLDTAQTLVLIASLGSREALELTHDIILKNDNNRMLLAGMNAAPQTTSSEDDEGRTPSRGLQEVLSQKLEKGSLRIFELFAITSADLYDKKTMVENTEMTEKIRQIAVFQEAEYDLKTNAELEKMINIDVRTTKYPFLSKPFAVSLVKKPVTKKERAASLGAMLLAILKSKETPEPTVMMEITEAPSMQKVSETSPVTGDMPEQAAAVPVVAEVVESTLMENGTIIFPPRSVGNFIGLPEQRLFPAHSQNPGEITVTVVCDNGLGDRLGSMYSAIALAHAMNAHFHVIWNVNNECLARFSVLFKFDGTSSSIHNNSMTDNLEVRMKGEEPAFDAIITLKHHFSTGHLVGHAAGSPTPPAEGQWLCGEARKVPAGPDGELVKWALARKSKGKRTHILYHIDRVAQGVDLKKVAAGLKHYNFRMSQPVNDRVNMFSERHKISPTNTVGIHLRGTDARIPLRINDVITDVRLRFPTRTFFVASDDAKAEKQFLEAFSGRAVSNTMKMHFPGKLNDDQPFRISGKLGAGRFNVNRTEPSVVDALTDMALLSRTERPIIDGVLRDSSFGKMSTTLCVVRLSCDDELGALAEGIPAPARPN